MFRVFTAACRASAIAILALAATSCGPTNVTTMQSFLGTGLGRPVVVLVMPPTFDADAVAVASSPLDKIKRKMKGTTISTAQRTVGQRVSQVIAATIVANLQEAGLPAAPGGPDVAADSMPGVVVGGQIKAVDEGNKLRRSIVGFGVGKSKVVADVQVFHVSTAGRQEVLSFAADANSGVRPGSVATAPAGAVVGTAASVASTAVGIADEKLSAEVNAQAKRIGEEIAQRVIDWSVQQGWINKPAS